LNNNAYFGGSASLNNNAYFDHLIFQGSPSFGGAGSDVNTPSNAHDDVQTPGNGSFPEVDTPGFNVDDITPGMGIM
jgi:hypothetical protein